MISISGPERGGGSSLCQFQGFALQMFPLADVLWTLAMALDTYLVVFHHFDAHYLRKLEPKYIGGNTTLTFIPALAFLFIHSDEKGPVYGSETIWCSISPKWILLRLILYYGPVWLTLAAVLLLYALIGIEISRLRDEFKLTDDEHIVLTSNISSDPSSDSFTPKSTQGSVTTTAEANPPLQNTNKVHRPESHITSHSSVQQAFTPRPPTNNTPITYQPSNQRRVSFKQYILMPSLFFLALLATWVAPTINRVSTFIHPQFVSFPLLIANQNNIIFRDTTIRQTVKITLGIARFFRLRFSNAFGTDDLTITETSIALAKDNVCGSRVIDLATVQKVTFDGGSETTISGGALIVSDPVDLGVLSPGAVLSISIFLESGQDSRTGITCHPGSRTSSFCALGNRVSDSDLRGSDVEELEHWYYISGIEILAPLKTGTLAIIGDSITDGRCSTTNANDRYVTHPSLSDFSDEARWPDMLFSRFQTYPPTASISVISQAAGGNRILTDGIGPNALSRLDRDILSLRGVRYVLLFEGVNDIGSAEPDEESQRLIGDRLIAGYRQIATRVHSCGIRLFAATVTPFGRREGEEDVDPAKEGFTWYSHPQREITRQRVNEWIRNSGTFDRVIDFDQVLRDESRVSVLAEKFDSGDRLHPNLEAFHALAESVPLGIFETQYVGERERYVRKIPRIIW
ncbi:hypothetical protein N7520_001930 [Penicillium odoratum]|uniref:uncharacterized protein n=1 Tax=Penicillium odoratum TaxID=1167516 RepID=UPI002546A31D|nr:uncharacterized protein N7520_001930 [Penicillium odoratum]KAJ5778684.1 hypothetical protein N7520_001930 [Penicillium odoratum]